MILIITILVFFAGTRLDIDNDFHMYFINMKYVEDSLPAFLNRRIPLEWCMYVIPHFFQVFFSSKVDVAFASIFFFALLGVSFKVIAIRKFANFFVLSIALYVSNLYLMMDMTTIRAGVAAGIFLWSIDDLEKKNHKLFFLKVLGCFFFHSSSVLFIIVWLVVTFKVNIKFLYAAVFLSLIAGLAKVNVLALLMLDRFFPRIEVYLKAMEWMKEKDANIFNFRILFALGIALLCGIFYKRLTKYKYFDILFRIHLISLCIFYLLSTSAQVFSMRSFELLSIVQILLYPFILYIFPIKLRIVGWIIIIAFSLLQIYYLVEVADIYKTYKSWLFN